MSAKTKFVILLCCLPMQVLLLQPLTNKSRRKLQFTENFVDAIKTVQIPDDYKLVCFDVKSLFTSIPLSIGNKQSTETPIQQYTVIN